MNRQSTKVPAYSIYKVFLLELPCHKILDTCSNMSKNAAFKREQKKVHFLSVEHKQGRPLGQPTNDKIQSYRRFIDLFSTLSGTARHLTVVIVISFILSCYFSFICDRIMLSAAKVSIKSRITKKNNDYLRKNPSCLLSGCF